MSERREPRDPGTYGGQISGLRWEAEKCPDASDGDLLKVGLGGGAIGFVGGLLMGFSPPMRLIAAAFGALIAQTSTRYHINLDWDPDALRGAPPPSDGDGDDDDPRPHPQPL